uniref:Beta-1,4-glucuronyltransferase 1 n=2 Tax=Hirondellea gigas TaxID=1518452 RepID=A0A6A7FZM2_9CRUS
MPRITKGKVCVSVVLVLVLNCLLLWNMNQHKLQRRRAFDNWLNLSNPHMLHVHKQLKKCSFEGGMQPNSSSVEAMETESPLKDSTPKCFYDGSLQFIYMTYSIKSAEQAKESTVCLSSQTSVDNLFWVSEQVETWSGTASVSVFVPDVDFTIALLVIKRMRECNPLVKRNVNFHFLYPIDMPPILTEFEFKASKRDCMDIENYNIELVYQIRTQDLSLTLYKLKYPQNILRNIARDECSSKYTFTPDIDMIATPKLHENLVKFLENESVENCDKCAYIVPTYEIALKEKNPLDKLNLLKYIKRRKARVFHVRAFNLNQANSRLSTWEVPPNSTDINVMYNINEYVQLWEPIYITKTLQLPKFDERFIGYGYTRNTQVLEMSVAGYTWLVLDTPFLSHRGFQSSKGRSRVRRKQIWENLKKFKGFRKELSKKYGIGSSDPRFGGKKDKKKSKKKG